MVLSLHGTHGTSKTRSELILKEGFRKPLKVGYVGFGTYFWSYTHPDLHLAEALARGWWEQDRNRGTFKRELKPECAVLFVGIETAKDQYLDTATQYFENMLYLKAKKQDVNLETHRGEFMEVVLRELEEYMEIEYGVVFARVTTPELLDVKGWKRFSASAGCYVVRRPNVASVQILDVTY